MRARADSDASLHLDHHLEDHLLHPADHVVDLGAAGHHQGALQHLHHGGHLALPCIAVSSLRKCSQVLLLLLKRLLLL